MRDSKQPSLMSFSNARYHHAKLVQQWLARPGCRIKPAHTSIRSSGYGA
jgi:hypothetical protein